MTIRAKGQLPISAKDQLTIRAKGPTYFKAKPKGDKLIFRANRPNKYQDKGTN